MGIISQEISVGVRFTATRAGNQRITREFQVVKVTPSGWLRCVSEAIKCADGTTRRVREQAIFKPNGSTYTTLRRSDKWAPHWIVMVSK